MSKPGWTMENDLRAQLLEALDRHDRLIVAVSGGVDSMTLAFVAHRFARGQISVVHAVSPAVPAEATARVESYAAREGWRFTKVAAGEFNDPSYRANPFDRCYFCKSCLYDRIGALADGTIASGANLDDLDDYRPGLKAAAERRVVHPFIEGGIDKAGVRALARRHGLTDLADLPAQPCLSSRVETGIVIDPAALAFIDRVEQTLQAKIPRATTLRCRITREGVAVEVADVGSGEAADLAALAAALCVEGGRRFLGVRPYRRGSAFVATSANGSAKA